MSLPLRALAALGLAWSAASAGAAAPEPAVPDTLQQRLLACTACHGKDGRASKDGYFPRIAGKPAGYLYNQLVNFREGRRSNATMGYFVEHMSDAYLRQIAGYFAALDLPYPPPRPAAAAPAVLAAGERLVRQGDAARGIPACAACHGSAMTGVSPAIPGLLGLPRDYLTAQFGAWKTGQRQTPAPDCMRQVADKLSAQDVSAVSSWLAAQPVPADAKPAAAVALPLPLDCGGSLK